MPGTPSKGDAYGITRRNNDLSVNEKALINFVGLQRTIAIGGVWLEGNVYPIKSFRQLHLLEEHFHAQRQNSKFIWSSLKKIGKDLVGHIGVENLQDYISGSSNIVAFTDFPIGLAIFRYERSNLFFIAYFLSSIDSTYFDF